MSEFPRGTVIGRLTVVSDADPRAVSLRCECGAIVTRPANQLRRAVRRGSSCGCAVCHFKAPALANRTHGMSGNTLAPEYTAWVSMHARCSRRSCSQYKNYGARGIRVCKRWSSFEAFIADVGTRPSPEHSIDRRDSSGNYEPDNCRWATPSEQARNRRNNLLITHNGRTMPLVAWTEESGLSYMAVYQRLRAGWTVSKALTKPVRIHRRAS